MNLIHLFNLIPEQAKLDIKLLTIGTITSPTLLLISTIDQFTPIIKFLILCLALLSGLITVAIGIVKFIQAISPFKKK